MHPYFVGQVEAVFERIGSEGTIGLYNLPVLGFVEGIGPPLVRHPLTGQVANAEWIPGYMRVIYTRTSPLVFHFCHTGLEGEPNAWKIHYACGDVRNGFTFVGE